MELKYEEALQEYDLKVSDLPEDAQTGIDNINDVIKGISMLEKKGKRPTAKTLRKLKAMDKWVYYEILDVVHGTEKNEEEMPHDKEELLEDIKENTQNETSGDETGYEIEAELQRLHESGKTEYTIEEIQGKAKKTYDILFKTYENGEENGIVTNLYSLIETKDKVFTISKN